jgi:hypothetical protein
MRFRFMMCLVVLLPAVASAQTADSSSSHQRFVGTWSGVLNAGAVPLRLNLVVRDSSGTLAGTMISVDQGNAEIPAVVATHGDSLTFALPTQHISYAGVLTPSGDTLRGTFTQGASFPLTFTRGAAATAPKPATRPQDPKPPFPYRSSDVTIPSVPGVELSCTLLTPAGAGPFPAVVFVTGSGPQDRDEALMGHRPFLVIADYLARHRIASLRCDDRGTAKSTGSFTEATSADFAADAEAGVKYLKTVSDVAHDHIGILGHSEGGLVGPLVASRTRDVAFLVLMAGPGVPGDSVLLAQSQQMARLSGANEGQLAMSMSINHRLFAAVIGARDSADAVARLAAAKEDILKTVPDAARPTVAQTIDHAVPVLTSPWMRFFLRYDPRPTLRAVHVPVLAIDGSLDVQVLAKENLAAIDTALTAGGNRDHREVELPGLNHLMQPAKTGLPSEYATIDETISPTALELIATWINQRFAAR